MEAPIAQFAESGNAGILLALFLGTFVSEDLACLAAGTLASSGRVDLWAAVTVCFLGILVGDILLYGAGRVFGGSLLESRLARRFVTSEQIDRGADWLRVRGASAIFVSRFVSGLRLPTYLAAGALRMPPLRFAAFFALAAAVWTPLLVGAAAVWQMSIPGGVFVGSIGVFMLFRLAFRMADRKTRILSSGRLRRIWQWEFWPLWMFYAPVVIYVAVLALRFRGLAFTAANPAMPAGGFVGESKDDTYRLIQRSETAALYLLKHIRIASSLAPAVRYRSAVRFIDDHSLSFPLVIKPDSGERGDGVTVVRDDAQLRDALKKSTSDVLLQEHFEGVEASVFYYRRPGRPHGRIFSITEKRFPYVTGDGHSTLESLILNDPRAHIIAEKYFERNRERLHEILAKGEPARLVEIGSHSKGAIFLDGEWLRTPELESKIDDICRSIPGFHFGRFDIRASSFEDLKRAANFRIIELNGVTSESTNIYDPRYSLLDAYRILFAQWRLAFEIGADNIRFGARPSTVREITSLVLANRAPKFIACNVRSLHRVS